MLVIRHFVLISLLLSVFTSWTQPTNGSCPNAILVPFTCNTITLSGTNVGAPFDNTGFCGTSVTSPSVWYTLPGGGTITASTCNQASFNSKISVFSGNCGSLICVGGADNVAGCAGSTAEFTWLSNPSDTYYVLLHAFGAASGTFDISFTRSYAETNNNSDIHICQGDSALIHGNYESIAGTYSQMYPSVDGCDSIDVYDLLVDPIFYNIDSVQTCIYAPYLAGGQLQNTSGVYFDTLQSILGCDSIIETVLTVINNSSTATYIGGVLSLSVPGDSYQWLDCDNGWSPLANDTLQAFTPQLNGNYAVAYTSNGCTDTSNCINVNDIYSASIGNEINSNGIQIFPNPTEGAVTISGLSDFEQISYALFSLDGKQITPRNIMFNQKSVMKLSVDPGIYVIHFFMNEKIVQTERIVKI